MILDEFSPVKVAAPYLKKSAIILAVCVIFFLVMILAIELRKSLFRSNLSLMQIVVGLLICAITIMAPIGVFYSWKSYKRKEGRVAARVMYLIGHAFFCILTITIVIITVQR